MRVLLAAILVCCLGTGVYAEERDQNLKNEHIEFQNKAVNELTISPYMLRDLTSPNTLLAGTVVPGVLITGMNSDLPGSVIGQVAQDVFDSATGRILLIPQGTKLMGVYDSRTAFAQRRGHVLWQRLIFPDGTSMVLPNFSGADREGYSGFKDKVRSHYARVVWSSILGAAITGGVASATEADDSGSFRAHAGAQASSNISSAVNSIVNKNMNIAPTVIIRPGYKFNIIIDKDLVLRPYAKG